ncbi:hypothetical protein JCM11641_001192, partial [Rhodosporidiobolus odoratus]
MIAIKVITLSLLLSLFSLASAAPTSGKHFSEVGYKGALSQGIGFPYVDLRNNLKSTFSNSDGTIFEVDYKEIFGREAVEIIPSTSPDEANEACDLAISALAKTKDNTLKAVSQGKQANVDPLLFGLSAADAIYHADCLGPRQTGRITTTKTTVEAPVSRLERRDAVAQDSAGD